MRVWLIAAALIGAATPALADLTAGNQAWGRGDYRAAVEEWRPLAVGGDPVAQYNLGQAYKLGRGVPVDPQMAESWFRKAALQGLTQGEDNYGLALFQADRKADALPWLEKSAGRGEPRAQLVLGTMLFNGDAVPRDYPRAYALMTRAAAQGLPSASQALAQMDEYISAADRSKGTALAQQYALADVSRPVANPNIVSMDAPTPAPAKVATTKTQKQVPAAKPTPAPKPVAPKPIAVVKAPTPKPVAPKPAVAAKVAATGGWTAQLGAFKTRAAAEALWAKVRGRMNGASASYSAAGALTRLQATGFASRAAAQKACAATGVNCLITD